MIINAEKAMFTAKCRGRAQYQLFDRKQSLKTEKQQRIAESMRHVLTGEEEQFSAVYQPLYHLQTGQFIGVEVLARWHSPEFGNVSPGEFIPLAESRGLINQLTCRIFKVIQADILSQNVPLGGKKPILAVNVSAQQVCDDEFQKKLMDFHQQVDEAGWQLEVELTETQVMSMTDVIIDRLGSWQAKGMRIAIDDFGTGYSCLAYLHMLPVNKLKIDRQFLQVQTQSKKEDEIMYAIMSMAKALNIEVLAEGIETPEQFKRLQQLGCSTGQGFGLSRPQAWQNNLMQPLSTE
jgi:two-component system CheB/CheR fusion protein